MSSPGKKYEKIAPAVRNSGNETISDFENQNLAVVGPGDRSGMVFGLTQDVLGRSETIDSRIPDMVTASCAGNVVTNLEHDRTQTRSILNRKRNLRSDFVANHAPAPVRAGSSMNAV